jgi:HSP20 family protein
MSSFLEKLKKGMGIEEIKSEKEKAQPKKEILKKNKEWPQVEGELVVDLCQTENDLYVIAPLAGVKREEVDIELENDVLTIKGERNLPLMEENLKFLQKECYWGKFSRRILLPEEIDPNNVEAYFKDGILIVKLPKIQREKKRKILPT